MEDIISTEELTTFLKLRDIDYDLSDDNLEYLINYKISELSGLLGVDLEPVEREYLIPKFKGDKIFLNFYPVYFIEEISINSNELEDFVLNKDIGVIYLDKKYIGFLEVNYTTRLPDKEIKSEIKP